MDASPLSRKELRRNALVPAGSMSLIDQRIVWRLLWNALESIWGVDRILEEKGMHVSCRLAPGICRFRLVYGLCFHAAGESTKLVS
jgi:hypothetical protein